jgi:hypothetical protein
MKLIDAVNHPRSVKAAMLIALAIALGIIVDEIFFLAALLAAIIASIEWGVHEVRVIHHRHRARGGAIITSPRRAYLTRSKMISRIVTMAVAALFLSTVAALAATKQRRNDNQTFEILTYKTVVSHFKAAGLRTTEVQKRCTIFFEGEWENTNVYDYALIVIENSDEDVQVTFYFTSAHEMNWVTEFLDAPFFTKRETEKLFALVNAHKSTETKDVGRYRVEFHHWQPKHAQILVFSFTPK